MVITWNREARQPRYSYRIYDYTSRSLSLEEWLENEGEILNEALDDCMEGLAAQMIRDVRFAKA
ncbi:MAG: hypothetical protein HKN57_08445 [Xanthomonadales bacterium]|nr:hypothetical protein [Gammaproteobacteria bacterium]NND57269.1 hypothetical protein [Xanthomonadales bacterium]NNK51625.1 hypothetical protein [Xanthomonadales bacterium]